MKDRDQRPKIYIPNGTKNGLASTTEKLGAPSQLKSTWFAKDLLETFHYKYQLLLDDLIFGYEVDEKWSATFP